MYTSYYGMRRYFPDKSKLVSISTDGGRAKRFKGRTFPALAPPSNLLSFYHKHKNQEFYAKTFQEKILDKMCAYDIAQELGDGTILLCYEKPNEFCHRHIVADWLRQHGRIEIEEFVPPPEKPKKPRAPRQPKPPAE